MNSTSRGFRARVAGLCLVAVLPSLSSCKVSRHQWSFSVTREFYSDGGPSLEPRGCDKGAAAFYLAFLLLPVAIDLVILPITLTHDLCER